MTIPEVLIFEWSRPQSYADVESRKRAILGARIRELGRLGPEPPWYKPLEWLYWRRRRTEICEECVQMLRVHIEPWLQPSDWTEFDQLLEELR